MLNFEEFEKLNEAYFPDLTEYIYGGGYGYTGCENLNVGWLDAGKEFETGEVPDGFVEKLSRIDPKIRHKGHHNCPFCGNATSSNVYVIKSGKKCYFAPEMIKHYIRVHNYKPPQEFIEAVMDKKIEEPTSRYKEQWRPPAWKK